MIRASAFFSLVLGTLPVGAFAGGGADGPGWKDVSEVFVRRCINCHAAHGASKGLRLDSYAATLEGSENGPVVVSGDPAASEMIRRLTGESTPRMPFLGRPLPPEELELIRRWIETGLRDEAG
ncbi:MAG: hypothetical protein LJE62_12110 [Silicimonas sp.]|jgi:uncharacterized membrane protein|nr:hypothetical protein [Silicimonas sp.]